MMDYHLTKVQRKEINRRIERVREEINRKFQKCAWGRGRKDCNNVCENEVFSPSKYPELSMYCYEHARKIVEAVRMTRGNPFSLLFSQR